VEIRGRHAQISIGLVGLVAAMELALEIGVETIAGELLRKRAWLVPALQPRDSPSLNADAKLENAGGSFHFSHPEKFGGAATKTLAEAGVIASLRGDRQAGITSASRRISTNRRGVERALDCCDYGFQTRRKKFPGWSEPGTQKL